MKSLQHEMKFIACQEIEEQRMHFNICLDIETFIGLSFWYFRDWLTWTVNFINEASEPTLVWLFDLKCLWWSHSE